MLILKVCARTVSRSRSIDFPLKKKSTFCCPNRHEPSSARTEVARSTARAPKAGFLVHHVSGGHYVLKRAERPELRVTVPWHGKDLKRKTLTSIIDQAGLTLDEFLDLI